MTTTDTRRYFVAPDGNDTPTLWFGTDTEAAPRLVAQETPSNRPADLSAPLFDLLTTILAPTDEDVERVADEIVGWDINTDLDGGITRRSATDLAQAVLRELARGVLA